MPADGSDAGRGDGHRLEPGQLRWRCDPQAFHFETTADLEDCPIRIIGQDRAQQALQLGLRVRAKGYNVFVSGEVGSGRSTVVSRALGELKPESVTPDDLVFVHNFATPDEPRLLRFPAGAGKRFRQAMEELVESLTSDLPRLYEAEPYRRRRQAMVERAAAQQKTLLREFEKEVEAQGFTLVQVQLESMVRPEIVPVVAANPVELDQLERLVEQDQFKREEFEELSRKHLALRGRLETVSKRSRSLHRELRNQLVELDRELARPLVEEATEEVADAFPGEEVADYLERLATDVLGHVHSVVESEASGEEPADLEDQPLTARSEYQVNVVVDNSETSGRPVLWETAPSYRNLFGTIDATRGSAGEWTTDHTRIKGGALLRANGGYLVLDALDVLMEPGVWPGLKRTLRHRRVEIQSTEPHSMFAGASLKPQPIPIDVKVVMIGTRQIYHTLHAVDEDFKKIFKVKAEFTTRTPRNDEELANYACLIQKRCQRETLPPFGRDAVAAVVEEGARLAGDRDKLTTRFTEIVDLVREAGYWALRQDDELVTADHVERAARQRDHRVNLLEEVMRQRIADGEVLIDVGGAKVGQVNGLALLDRGDHLFALPSRITATTALGRAGIIDIDRESEMAGSIHTKGVLILTGFLRERFAQDKPLTLTASLCFEQSYGGVEGDSASAAELYALLSSLAGAPFRQGVAVTGSVNQRGEMQPIGGVNEKIEGYFDLCRLGGLTGEQGVLIPSRNARQLMLRGDVVEAARDGRFHVWAVRDVAEGVEILSGLPAGLRAEDGGYPDGSLFARVDARLRRLADEVGRYGAADLGQAF